MANYPIHQQEAWTFPLHRVLLIRTQVLIKYTFGTLVWISLLDRAPGHLGQGIIVIKLILVDFDGHNANITLKICTDVVYIHVYVV